MKTNSDRLNWAIKWAYGSPDASIEDLQSFIALEKGSQLMAVPDRGATHDEIARLHGDVRNVVDLLVDDQGFMPTITLEKRPLVLPRRSNRTKQRPPVLIVSGAFRDVVLEVLYFLLLTTPIDRIKRCPGCKTVFVRTGRQTHCTPACYNRGYWARLSPDTVERYRERQYEKGNWQRGARLQRIATKAETGGAKT